MKNRVTAILLLLCGSFIVACKDKESGPNHESSPEQETAVEPASVPEQRTVRGLLNHYPSDVKSSEAWHDHNFMVGATPVIPTEEIPEETLKSFVGSQVIVTGVWHPGEKWNPTEEQRSLPAPVEGDNEVVVRGDGLKATSISPMEK